MKKLAIIVCVSAFVFSVVARAADSDSNQAGSSNQTVRMDGTGSGSSGLSGSSVDVSSTAASIPDSRPSVPRSISSITNPELRNAVSIHSPNFDDLSRGSQVFTYIHVFKSMNDGLMPAVASEDLDLIFRLEPVQSTDDVTHYNAVPTMLIETTTVPSRTEWNDNYERYMSDHDLDSSSSTTTR